MLQSQASETVISISTTSTGPNDQVIPGPETYHGAEAQSLYKTLGEPRLTVLKNLDPWTHMTHAMGHYWLVRTI
jgi:hypothetical protein